MVDSENLLPNLLCHENESCLSEEFHKKDENFQFNSVPDSDFEYVEMLIQRETNSGNDYSPRSEKSWLKGARLDAVKWILDTRALFGFHFRTAYLSLIYFDQFFSRRSIDDGKIWAIRLLSVACLSVAAKMEECNVPALSEYHINEYNFEGNLIQRMELLVLSTLEWKMNVVTPFEYLHYFATKFYGEFGCNELVKLAFKLILAVMEEINLVELRPSIIAASAILAAYDHQLTKNLLEIKLNLVPSWGCIEKDHAFSCYNLLQKIAILKLKSPKSVISPHSLSTHSSAIDVLDDSTIGTKRSLTYCDDKIGFICSNETYNTNIWCDFEFDKGSVLVTNKKNIPLGFSLQVMSKRLTKSTKSHLLRVKKWPQTPLKTVDGHFWSMVARVNE